MSFIHREVGILNHPEVRIEDWKGRDNSEKNFQDLEIDWVWRL